MILWRALPILCFIGAGINALVYIFDDPPYTPNNPVFDGVVFLIAGIVFLYIDGHMSGEK